MMNLILISDLDEIPNLEALDFKYKKQYSYFRTKNVLLQIKFVLQRFHLAGK